MKDFKFSNRLLLFWPGSSTKAELQRFDGEGAYTHVAISQPISNTFNGFGTFLGIS